MTRVSKKENTVIFKLAAQHSKAQLSPTRPNPQHQRRVLRSARSLDKKSHSPHNDFSRTEATCSNLLNF